jgi:hypothetical protein
MLFLRDKNSVERKEGLGVHDFSRVPIAGEYICLSNKDKTDTYKVTHVVHTGFGSHSAELYVVQADDGQIIGSEFLPNP